MDEATSRAARLMAQFARRTGLDPAAQGPQRYLWTDAFAVCNFLELHARTGEQRYLRLTRALIVQVHGMLSRFRADDIREGWISGLGEEEGARRPTAGGLRIGKPQPERGPREPFDERAEWNRDGQYFHYLTKWMHALTQASAATGEVAWATQAGELAQAAMKGFAERDAFGRLAGVFWKMSTDLTRPLVPSTGAHDALDGFLTLREVARVAPGGLKGLEQDTAMLAEICEGRHWATDDPLSLGGLLFDAARLCAFAASGGAEQRERDGALLIALLAGCERGLSHLTASRALERPPVARLAFRELGLAIGLKAIPAIAACLERTDGTQNEQPKRHLAGLARYAPLAERITGFWLEPQEHRHVSWLTHEDINAVMLATALIPDGFLALKGA